MTENGYEIDNPKSAGWFDRIEDRADAARKDGR